MNRFALVLLCCACASAPPPKPAPQPAPADVRPAQVVDDNVAVEYRAQSAGQTLIEVASPPGTRVDVHEAQALVGRDVAPMTVRAEGDHWYVVSARLPSGESRETKVQARAGQIASVHFAQPAPQGPQAMSHDAFK